MANEARVFAEGTSTSLVRYFTVANGTALSKGWLMIAPTGGTRTAIPHATSADVGSLGFTVQSKDANDGVVSIGLQRGGVVVAIADSVVQTGDVVMAGTTANRLKRITGAALSYQGMQSVVGRALEDAAVGGAFKVALTLM